MRELIDAGRLLEGQRLPPEGRLAEALGVSLAPVRQALLSLVGEGYLKREQGNGTFVRAAKVEERLSVLSGFTEAHACQLDGPMLRVVTQGLISTGGVELGGLRLSGSKVFELARLAFFGETPAALLVAYLDPAAAPGIELLDFTDRSLYQTLSERYGITMVFAESSLELVRVDGGQTLLLGAPKGSQVLRLESTTFSEAGPIEYSTVTYRPENFRFNFVSYRTGPEIVNVPRTLGSGASRSGES